MDENISALMDGELNPQDASIMISQLGNTDGLRDQWAAYHLIGDAMKKTELAPFDITRRVNARLAVEPPLRAVPSSAFGQRAARKHRRPVAFAAAASVAAMVVGGWMSLQVSQSSDPRQQNLADNRPAIAPAGTPAAPSAASVAAAPSIPANMAVQVSVPAQIDSYLMAHRQFSPSTAVHGATPYLLISTDSHENVAR